MRMKAVDRFGNRFMPWRNERLRIGPPEARNIYRSLLMALAGQVRRNWPAMFAT
jgi:hypothetical protein